MDFRMTDEQRMLRRTIRDLVEKEMKPRAAEWDRSGQLPWDNIRRLAEIEVTGLTIPTEYGGAGQSLLEGVFAIEEIARGCPNTALALISGMGVVSLAIVQYGTEEQKRKYLPPIAAGSAVSAICMTEPGAGSATSQVQTNATRRADGYVVTGRKCMISREGLPTTTSSSAASRASRASTASARSSSSAGHPACRSARPKTRSGSEGCRRPT